MKAVTIAPPAPPAPVPNIAKTVNTSQPMASKAMPQRPEHKSPASMLSHVRKTCNGKC